MKVLSIIDSFKGTITSNDLGKLMSDTLQKKDIEADYIPISDGGDGFLDVIEKVITVRKMKVRVLDPLKRMVETYYLLDEKNKVAYIELAKSSGINLLKKEELNPFITTTYGLGQTIIYAIESGIKKIIVGIGGSATNDGGSGMLEAMGCLFYDKDDNLLEDLSGGVLDRIERIDPQFFFKKIKDIDLTVLSDVRNPLLGETGATFVFSKQKGASNDDIKTLEIKMSKYSKIVSKVLENDFVDSSGSGAAGGVGFAFKSFFKAKFYQGINYILDLVNFDNLIKEYDYIITGEGKIDEQSLSGKVVFEVSKRAEGKKIILVCAVNEIDEKDLEHKNIYRIYSIVESIASSEESLNNPLFYYKKLCESIQFE